MILENARACDYCENPGEEYFAIEPDPSWDRKTLIATAIDVPKVVLCESHHRIFTQLRGKYHSMEK